MSLAKLQTNVRSLGCFRVSLAADMPCVCTPSDATAELQECMLSHKAHELAIVHNYAGILEALCYSCGLHYSLLV